MSSSRRAISKSERIVAAVTAGLVLGFTEASLAAGLDVSGSVRTGYWHQDKSFASDRDRSGYGTASLWLNAVNDDVGGWRLLGEGYVYGGDLGRKEKGEGEVRELYLARSFGDLDLRIGRQVIVWGRADKINPTDSFSTRDLTRLMTDDEDQRLGLFATQARYAVGDVTVTFVWQPEWRDPVYPVNRTEGIAFATRDPDRSRYQGGVRIDRSGGDVDWSVSYFDGLSRTPHLGIANVEPELLTLELDYRRVHVAGFDLATTAGDFGLRAEAAYTRTADSDGEDPLAPNSFYAAVVGGERSFGASLNVNVQGLYRHVEHWESPDDLPADPTAPYLPSLAKQAALVAQQHDRSQTGASIRPSLKLLNDTLELETAYVRWFHDASALVRPKVNYSLSDQFRLIGGAEHYMGPDYSFFGRLKDLSSVFAEVRWLY